MSALVKTKLKTAREAIKNKEWEKARTTSLGVLDYEADNYLANVILGISQLNLKEYEQSEQAFRKAIEIDPNQLPGWEGLHKWYDEIKPTDCQEHLKVLNKAASLYAAANGATKCAEAVQKIIEICREPDKATRVELVEALSLLLPESPYYSVLSTLPPPDPTNPTSTTTYLAQSAIHNSLPILEELVSIYTQEEEATERNELEKQRQRLHAPPRDQIERAVALEILNTSKLPHLYNEVINHAHTSNELRRATEAKLLRLKYRHLSSLPAGGQDKSIKAQLAVEVEELVDGMVLLKIPDELAWTLRIESKDAPSIEDYEFDMLRQYTALFPSSPMTRLIQAYFNYMGVSLFEDEEVELKHAVDDEVDYIDAIMEAFAGLTDSIFAHRIVADLYEQDADWENALKVSESGLEVVRRVEATWGRAKKSVRKAFNIILATSLVHHYPPKNHVRALRIIEELLTEDSENVPALMGRGFILEHAENWTDAAAVFARVVELVSEDFEHGLRAREEHAWCNVMSGELNRAAEELQDVVRVVDGLDGRYEDKSRSLWRLGRCYWEMGDQNREEAYKQFIAALKRSSTFAPAFTSLGIYYSNFLSPPDPDRASKCFQKAFELDPREAYAARKLAEGFAEEEEWDLVEVVARRTIEGEGGLEGPEAKASRRYLPINAWAWKAIAAVGMTRRNYVPAIEALQIALRTDVDDHTSWLRLGEAYSHAGRYAAAFKALERARELNRDDWISSYFIGDVQRQMGAYEEAIKAFQSILKIRPQELCVLHSLGQSYLDLGRFELATGFSARAETSFISAVRITLELLNASSGFRRVAWKTITDALFHLSSFSVFFDEDIVRGVVSSIVPLVTEHPGKGLADILVYPLSLDNYSLPLSILQVALAAYDYRLSLDGINDAARGAAQYDLGVALSALARHTLDSAKRQRAEQDAIAQFKNALRLEPMNDSFWVALGNATFGSQPRTCQHSYIRAIELDNKNAATWTNLGMFYLYHEDSELANEAFYKAQTLDPDYALAWVGQGLVATFNKHHQDASALFEHAVGLTAAVPEADLQYATRLFNKVNAAAKSRIASSEALLPAFFVLDRYCKQRPQDATALHLFGLVCERVGHVELGVRMISRGIAVLEAAYEETEETGIERQFTTAHANVARLKLSIGDYEGALRSYEVALGLLAEQPEDGEGEPDPQTRALLAQCQFGAGLTNFKLGQLQEALGLFETAMTTSAENTVIRGHVVVLLAQTLWAIGTDEAKDSAKTQLLESIEYDSENLMAINTLAGMGILTDDDGLVDAALSELLSLPLDQRHERDPERDITYLLVQHHLGQGDIQIALSVAQKAVFVEPERSIVRRELSSLILQNGQSAAALAILGGSMGTAGNFDQLRASLALHAMALCLESESATEGDAAADSFRLAQKGIMLSPWDQRGWEVLAYIRSRSVR